MERRMREYGRGGFEAENGLQYNGGGSEYRKCRGITTSAFRKGQIYGSVHNQ